MALKLESPAFSNGGVIPLQYTATAGSLSPPLRWLNVPEGTRELALLCDDPDAPTPRPFVHWIWWGMDPSMTQLPAGISGRAESGEHTILREGKNSLLTIGYTGPNPPFWHGPHRYFFRLFALDQKLELSPGTGRREFLDAIHEHVIEEATLLGFFGKSAALKRRSALRVVGLAAVPVAVVSAWRMWRRGAEAKDDQLAG